MVLGKNGKSVRDGAIAAPGIIIGLLLVQYASMDVFVAGAIGSFIVGGLAWFWRGVRRVSPTANKFDPLVPDTE